MVRGGLRGSPVLAGVGERHREAVHLAAVVGAVAVVRNGEHPALHLLVLRRVVEGVEIPGVGVDIGHPKGRFPGHPELEAPRQQMIVAAADRTLVSLADPARRIDRQEFQATGPGLLDLPGTRHAQPLEQRRVRLGPVEEGAGRAADRSEAAGAERHETSAADVEVVAGAPHGDAVDDLPEGDQADVLADAAGGLAVEPELAVPAAEDDRVFLDEPLRHRGELVEARFGAATGRIPLDPGALRQERKAGAPVQPGLPTAPLAGPEPFPTGAHRIACGQSLGRRTQGADPRRRIGDREVVESRRLPARREGLRWRNAGDRGRHDEDERQHATGGRAQDSTHGPPPPGGRPPPSSLRAAGAVGAHHIRRGGRAGQRRWPGGRIGHNRAMSGGTARDVGVVEAFGRERAVAILRTGAAEAVRPAMEAAVRGGFRIVEFTLSCPGAFEAIEAFAGREGLLVGAGTVLHPDQVRRAAAAGASFVVSPVVDEAVIAEALRCGLTPIPGCGTATEMHRARAAGAPMQKLFPAPPGGADFVRALLGPLPELRIVPTSGVDERNARAFLDAGAHAVGFVAPLFPPEDLLSGRFEAIEERARRLLASCR
ncbi:MAG: hypothetical protein D6718_06780 [Acidobacteria bacterium]|nr:MAG: hypothetical protein D6718_06780 [Acidobacteriota bacterium]